MVLTIGTSGRCGAKPAGCVKDIRPRPKVRHRQADLVPTVESIARHVNLFDRDVLESSEQIIVDAFTV